MQRSSKLLIHGRLIADLLLLTAIIIIPRNLILDNKDMFSGPNLIVLFTALTCWVLSSRPFGLYEDFRFKPFSTESIVFFKSLAFYTLIISFVFFQFSAYYPLRNHQFLLHCTLIAALFPLQKLIIRLIAKEIRNHQNIDRKVLIVGTGHMGMNFYQQFIKDKRYGYNLTGFVDDTPGGSLDGHYLGTVAEIDKVVTEHELDDIVVTLSTPNESQIKQIISIAERQGKRVRIIPNYQQFTEGNLQVDKLGKLSVITLRSLPLDLIDNRIYKRVLDVLFSLAVITLIFSWLFPIIAILIKLTSKGPVFFKQERWGINNKTIICLKFRSMVNTSCDVDEKGQYKQACKNDKRVTPIGRFLRKTSLDELPQFINVLFGSMSVVGPRPHPVPLNEISKDSVEGYMMRHWVKPGITGWAQVNGFRGETSDVCLMKKRVEHDVWYMENWTFWLDLQIILQTVVNLVKGEDNAY